MLPSPEEHLGGREEGSVGEIRIQLVEKKCLNAKDLDMLSDHDPFGGSRAHFCKLRKDNEVIFSMHARNCIQSAAACGGLPRRSLTAITRKFSSTPCNRGVTAKPVVTFNPNLMEDRGQSVANISELPHVLWRLGSKLRPRYSHNMNYAIDYHPGPFMYRKPPFPADTKGFFYYGHDKYMPPISGSLRFRVCEDLAGFDRGHDLLTEMKEPWAVPLIRIVRDKIWAVTLQQLINDGQVEETLVRSIKRLQMPWRTVRNRPLFVPHQPFSFNLKHKLLALTLITPFSTSRVDFQHLFYDSGLEPLEGCVKLAFELMNPEPPEGPTLTLRILDILTPIKYPKGGKRRELEVGLLKRWALDEPKIWDYPLSTRSNGSAWLAFIKSTRRWHSWPWCPASM